MEPIRGQQKSFDPVYCNTSKVLILGSYPSPKSFANGFYYGHKQNRFWPVISTITGQVCPQTNQQKQAFILQNNLALWDSIAYCQIKGASDASITNVVPNNINCILKKSQVKAIFCNGNASFKFYCQYCQEQTGISATKLPSTSSANARYSINDLIKNWSIIKDYI